MRERESREENDQVGEIKAGAEAEKAGRQPHVMVFFVLDKLSHVTRQS